MHARRGVASRGDRGFADRRRKAGACDGAKRRRQEGNVMEYEPGEGEDETILDVLGELESLGFTGQFMPRDGGQVECLTCHRLSPADETVFRHLHRLEGATDPGFVHDRFSAFYPLAAASPVIRGLALEDFGLRWRHAPVALANPTPDGGCAVLSTDVDETAASLDNFAPGDGGAWREL